MKKILYYLCFLTCSLLLLAGCSSAASQPDEETVFSLLQQAESFYHLGDSSVLQTSRTELILSDPQGQPVGYYDQLDNYEDAVSTVFTPNGIAQLEQSYCSTLPRILKREDGVYRVSSMTDADTIYYFSNPSALKLVKQDKDLLTYELTCTTQSDKLESSESLTLTVTLSTADNKLLVEQLNYPSGEKADGAYTSDQLASFTFS